MYDVNIIKLHLKKSYLENNMLIINDNAWSFSKEQLTIFKTQKEYEDQESEIQYAQTHYSGKMAYIEDRHILIIGGDIDNLGDEEFNINGEFEKISSFFERISKIAICPFKIATVFWEDRGYGVYYMKYHQKLQFLELLHDEWDSSDLFKKIVEQNNIDIHDDHFDTNKRTEILNDIYNNYLLENPEILAPKWY